MRYATAPDGARLALDDVGAGEPLVLISGQAGDRHAWDQIREDFRERYRLITFDHRGTGDSDKPETPAYSIPGFASDVVAILDALGVERAHVYGFSMGGRIAQSLAIAYPDRVGAIVLGATTPGNAHGVRRSPDVDAKMANRPVDPEERVRVALEWWVTPVWAAAHPEFVSFMLEGSRRWPVPQHAQRLHYAASEGHDSWDLLPTITAPTLVIHGDDDRVNPTANAALLAARIPGAECYIVKGAQHGYHVEHREEASRVVKDFLMRHPLEPK